VESDTLHCEGGSKFATLKSPTLCPFVLLVKVGWRQCGVLRSDEGRSLGHRQFMPQLKKVEHLGRILYLEDCIMKKNLDNTGRNVFGLK